MRHTMLVFFDLLCGITRIWWRLALEFGNDFGTWLVTWLHAGVASQLRCPTLARSTHRVVTRGASVVAERMNVE